MPTNLSSLPIPLLSLYRKSIRLICLVTLLTSLCLSSTDTPLDPNPIRLMNGNSSEGRVEIYYNSEWGTICDRDWDMDDANVACHSLGFPGAAAAPTGVCDITVIILMW